MKHIKDYATVFTNKNAQHMVMLPNWQLIPGIIKTVVTDSHDEIPTVTITLHCNLATDYNAAKEVYKEDKDQL